MSRLRMGIVGCGSIAQIQYLPLLAAMPDEFEIAALCDLSRDVLETLGDRWRVPAAMRFRSVEAMAESAIDAAVICNTGSHVPPATALARAGKHVMLEKPICTERAEGESLCAVVAERGVVAMAAYMKQHDPAFPEFLRRVHAMTGIRFVQVNHLHPDNSVHLAKFPLVRAADIPADVIVAANQEHANAVTRALGYDEGDEVPAAERLAFLWTHGSLIHDIGNLTATFGQPVAIRHTEIWIEGNSISTTLEFAGGVRAVCNWIDLPVLPVFEETFAVYGESERVIVSFPTGFSIGQPSTLVHHYLDETGAPVRAERSWTENPFQQELIHFRDCILNGTTPRTTIERATADIGIVADIVRAARGALA